MITKLSVQNFKSVKQLDIDCKKINLFIGEPNTGKSNILEALGFMSWCAWSGGPLRYFIRLQVVQNLFYDQLLDSDVRISVVGKPTAELRLHFREQGFALKSYGANSNWSVTLDDEARNMTFEGLGRFPSEEIKFFRFREQTEYDKKRPGSLCPPDGNNLFTVVFASKSLRETMAEFFRKYGLKLVLKPQEGAFELQRQMDELVFSFPYALASDTLRRIIFYTVAIASNKDSVLVFEEPESNAFPYYTKYLGERIALDETNQFFIATHNPYLLSAVIEKGRKEDVQVFITYFEDYQTKVKPLTADQLAELMEADPFFNLERFIEEGK
jgi:AAA15 family ATPase/GTPase